MLATVRKLHSTKATVLAVATILFIVIAVADANTSVELSLTLFYLANILLVTWN